MNMRPFPWLRFFFASCKTHLDVCRLRLDCLNSISWRRLEREILSSFIEEREIVENDVPRHHKDQTIELGHCLYICSGSGFPSRKYVKRCKVALQINVNLKMCR